MTSSGTALVTGGTGFVGASVVRRLLADGIAVRCLARAGSDRRNLDGLDIEIAEGDLGDTASLRAATTGCSSLFHVAADYRLWVPDPDAMMRTNVEGTKALMRAAMDSGIERIVYTSSVAVLGGTGDGTQADEQTNVSYSDMIGPYKQSKFLAEQAVFEMINADGLPVVIVNPSTPVGPRDIRPTPTGRLILEAATGKIPAFVDTGLNIVHVDDVAAGHLLAFHQGDIGSRYILGGEDMSLREILGHIAEFAHRSPPRISLPHGLILPIAHIAETWTRLTGGGEPFVTVDGVRMARKKMYFSSDRARAALGYDPRSGRDALKDAVAWFLADHT